MVRQCSRANAATSRFPGCPAPPGARFLPGWRRAGDLAGDVERQLAFHHLVAVPTRRLGVGLVELRAAERKRDDVVDLISPPLAAVELELALEAVAVSTRSRSSRHCLVLPVVVTFVR